jgi:type VI secretion system secreted protein Hcp
MSRMMSDAGCCVAVALVLSTATLAQAQAVRRAPDESQAARTSKVDAITIKQTAAGPAYLKINGVKGESTARRHEGAIEIVSWSWGAGGPQSNRSGSLTINKRADASSSQLAAAAAQRRSLGRMTLTLPPAPGSDQPQVVTLHDAVVASIQPSGGSTESVSFNYTKIEF